MKNICAWLCPPKKKNEGPYDVHEQTFEMEENFADIQEAEKQSNPSARIQSINTNEKAQSNESLTLNSQNEDKAVKMQNEEKKYIQNKNKIQQQQNARDQININEEKVQLAKEKVEFQKKQVESSSISEQIKEQKIEQEKPKPKYNILPSSIKKKTFNPEDYFFKQQQNQFRVKGVDSLKGQQFNIDFCKKGTYFIFDITANIYVDDSEDCIIFAAPCESSLFVRNCKNMIITAVVGQLRTYNCHNCHFSIFCKSQPVIESSSNIHFSTLECPQYGGLKQQFKRAKVEPWNNNWSQIHNFTKKQGQVHHFLERKNEFKQIIDWQRAYKLANLQMVKQKQQIVPFIQGIFPLEQEAKKILLIFDKETSQNDGKVFEWVKQKNIHILKASKMRIGGQKHMTLAILINNKLDEEYDLQSIGNPEKISQKQQLQGKVGKYFITYKDQR